MAAVSVKRSIKNIPKFPERVTTKDRGLFVNLYVGRKSYDPISIGDPYTTVTARRAYKRKKAEMGSHLRLGFFMLIVQT